MKLKIRLVLLFLWGITFATHSQKVTMKLEKEKIISNSSVKENKTLTGVILDEKAEPIIGASVMLRGTSTGTISDIDGHFSISVHPGDVLQISYVGYLEQLITLNSAT